MYKFVFFVPTEHAEEVKERVFAAGAGRIGCYDKCSWEVEGWGQFRPLRGSEPAIGEHGLLEKVRELRVELVCERHLMKAILVEFKKAHPYEEPAFEVIEMVDIERL